MNPQPPLPNVTSVPSWNEELARAKKYKEATQKRAAEKKLRKEALTKTSPAGRLVIEP